LVNFNLFFLHTGLHLTNFALKKYKIYNILWNSNNIRNCLINVSNETGMLCTCLVQSGSSGRGGPGSPFSGLDSSFMVWYFCCWFKIHVMTFIVRWKQQYQGFLGVNKKETQIWGNSYCLSISSVIIWEDFNACTVSWCSVRRRKTLIF
jgi:hypothetical protein